MARVRFLLAEAYHGDVPGCCVRCGQPATALRDRAVFTGLFGLPYLILPYAPTGTDQLWVRLPFCDRHKHLAGWRNLTGLGLLALAVVATAGTCLFTGVFPPTGQHGDSAGLLCVAVWGSLVFWFFGAVALRLNGFSCPAYDEVSLTLAGISVEFAWKLKALRRATEGFRHKAPRITWEQMRNQDRPPLPPDGIQTWPATVPSSDEQFQPGE